MNVDGAFESLSVPVIIGTDAQCELSEEIRRFRLPEETRLALNELVRDPDRVLEYERDTEASRSSRGRRTYGSPERDRRPSAQPDGDRLVLLLVP